MKLKKFAVLLFTFAVSTAFSCTNISYKYDNAYLVARNFDWMTNNIAVVVNPVATKRQTVQLAKNEKPLRWQSQYGSVTFDMTTPHGKVIAAAVMGGMNQQGLVVSLLNLSGATFQKPSKRIPNINNTYLVQYWLDNFKSVPDAVAALKHLNVVTTWWQGKPVPIHYVLRDAEGRTAIVEYLKSKRHVYQGSTLPFRVLTNTSFIDSIKLVNQSHGITTTRDVKSSYSSRARYQRGIEFLKRMPAPQSSWQAVGYGFAALQDVAEPPGSPWPTMWSVVYNTQSLMMYYRTLSDPRIRIINLKKLDFKKTCIFPIEQVSLNVDQC